MLCCSLLLSADAFLSLLQLTVLSCPVLSPPGMEELPRDFTKMFDYDVFKFDVDLIPQAKVSKPAISFSLSPSASLPPRLAKHSPPIAPVTQRLYETLGVPHEPLTLIPPQFECPMPKLSPATFPPAMREPAPPALDQFDLDEHFAKEGQTSDT